MFGLCVKYALYVASEIFCVDVPAGCSNVDSRVQLLELELSVVEKSQ